MGKMRTVTILYVVTTGSYSDYRVEGIFTTRELAQRFMEKAGTPPAGGIGGCTNLNDIEEYELDAGAQCEWKTVWIARINLDTGDLRSESEYVRLIYPGSPNEWMNCTSGPVALGHSYKSPAHARKLAAEQRQKWLREKAT